MENGVSGGQYRKKKEKSGEENRVENEKKNTMIFGPIDVNIFGNGRPI